MPTRATSATAAVPRRRPLAPPAAGSGALAGAAGMGAFDCPGASGGAVGGVLVVGAGGASVAVAVVATASLEGDGASIAIGTRDVTRPRAGLRRGRPTGTSSTESGVATGAAVWLAVGASVAVTGAWIATGTRNATRPRAVPGRGAASASAATGSGVGWAEPSARPRRRRRSLCVLRLASRLPASVMTSVSETQRPSSEAATMPSSSSSSAARSTSAGGIARTDHVAASAAPSIRARSAPATSHVTCHAPNAAFGRAPRVPATASSTAANPAPVPSKWRTAARAAPNAAKPLLASPAVARASAHRAQVRAEPQQQARPTNWPHSTHHPKTSATRCSSRSPDPGPGTRSAYLRPHC